MQLVCRYCGTAFIRKNWQPYCSHGCYVEQRRSDPRIRFYSYVDKGAEPDSCWIWKGATMPNGYGNFSIGRARRNIYAHRMAWEFAHGAIPTGMCVCHKCDVRGCVNPSHLFLGTVQDNLRDMFSKGRGGHGVTYVAPKLTPDLVEMVRKEFSAGGVTKASLARTYGVSESLIFNVIAHRRAYRD